MIKKGLILYAVLFLMLESEMRQYNKIASLFVVSDFDGSIAMINQLKSSEEREVFLILYGILHHKGQDALVDRDAVSKLHKMNLTDELNLIRDLSITFFEIYYNRTESTSLERLEKLYQNLNKTDFDGFKKLILKGFLIIYSRENTLNKEQFDFYLERFNSFELSKDEKALLLFYQNFFDGMSASLPERYKESIKSLYDYLLIHENKLGKEIRNNMYHNIALDFRVRNQVDSSEKYLKKILVNTPSKYDQRIRFNTFLELGRVATIKGENEKAYSFFQEAELNFDKNDSLRSKVLYDRYLAFNFYEIQKMYDSAYFALKSSRLNEAKFEYKRNNEKISELNTRLRTEEKEKQILIEQQKARTNQNWLIAAVIVLFLGTGIAILLQKNTTKKRQLAEQEAVLKQQRVENLLKEQELVSIDAMIAGQEKERQRVAGELHDDLGSLMATIKLHFDNAKVSKKDPALQNAQKLLEEAYQKIRGMAHSKNSGVMSDQGLLPAIKKMAKTITETNAIAVTVEDFGMGERLENSLELSIFRMVQELVANAIKHADASQVNIQLTQHEDNLNIIVEDNGEGFDRYKLDKRKSGMGLTNIEKRVEHLEGSFTVDSIIGKGTSILIDLPV